MIVFANTTTSRLQYILDFIGGEILGKPIQVTNDAVAFKAFNGPKINYSQIPISDYEFHIANASLLFETGVRQQDLASFDAGQSKAFFKTKGHFPFDIFAASFYLLSRYEEWLPHTDDQFGRYAHENSLAFKENFLHLPIINIWIAELTRCLVEMFPGIATKKPVFQLIPTYDIDEAFSYQSKKWWRTLGGLGKDVIRGQFSQAFERLAVLWRNKKDPYDAFAWMDELNIKYGLSPVYFVLMAASTRRYDKNNSPATENMKSLISATSRSYAVGIHPSWRSGDDTHQLKSEISELKKITGKEIKLSRQHYLRFKLPFTYRILIEQGIEVDYSMGYGTINGFRASVASPFFWYDLENEKQTTLRLVPFCFMDANAFYEQHLSPAAASEELGKYLDIVRSVNGTLVTIWHNNFLGTAPRFKGWGAVYEQFIVAARS